MEEPAATSSGAAPTLDSTPYSLIGALCGLGFLEAGYLTISKFLNASIVCPTSGCEDVLSSG